VKDPPPLRAHRHALSPPTTPLAWAASPTPLFRPV
jgi:hypothetical protein